MYQAWTNKNWQTGWTGRHRFVCPVHRRCLHVHRSIRPLPGLYYYYDTWIWHTCSTHMYVSMLEWSVLGGNTIYPWQYICALHVFLLYKHLTLCHTTGHMQHHALLATLSCLIFLHMLQIMISRGVRSCPIGCDCDCATRCGRKYPRST